MSIKRISIKEKIKNSNFVVPAPENNNTGLDHPISASDGNSMQKESAAVGDKRPEGCDVMVTRIKYIMSSKELTASAKILGIAIALEMTDAAIGERRMIKYMGLVSRVNITNSAGIRLMADLARTGILERKTIQGKGTELSFLC